jgi:hypothetical protein
MFGWSCAAQRGCWKLFHDTPTVHGTAAVDALAPPPPVLGADVALLEHAAMTIAATAINAANLRFAICSNPPRWDLTARSVPRVPR